MKPEERPVPKCSQCNTDLPIEYIAVGSGGVVACECGCLFHVSRVRHSDGVQRLPRTEERRCREGHTFVTSEDEVGRCWCGARVEIVLVW